MILSDRQIKAAVDASDIIITPWNPNALGTNSYDVHLAKTLKVYRPEMDGYGHILPLSTRRPTPTRTVEIGPRGFVLRPGTLYLGATEEYTETRKYVPFVDGKSSIGRLGITIHCTAGRGDVGFKGHWTLEIHVVEPVEVFAGDPIGQLIFFETGAVDVPYDRKSSAKYNNTSPMPQESMMHLNFQPGGKYHVDASKDDPYDCGACDGSGHADGCEAREPAHDLATLVMRAACDGCCPDGHKPTGMQALQDKTSEHARALVGRRRP